MIARPLALAALLSLLTTALPALALAQPSSDGNRPYIIVNGVSIPASHADYVRRDRANRGAEPAALSDESIREALSTLEILAQEAERKKLDDREDARIVLALQRKELLVKLLQDDFVRQHRADEARIRSEYDNAKARAGDIEYHARHILVADEKTAKDLIAQMGKNKKLKFEDLAKKHSKDATAAQGGDLGWMAPKNVVPEFAQAMTALKKGSTGKTPVKTQFGWHVIKLEDVRKVDFPEFDKVRAEIARQLVQIDFRRHVEQLRERAKIDLPSAP
jgi:peptidyl-prolyl cis-trans isomerase C